MAWAASNYPHGVPTTSTGQTLHVDGGEPLT
jgi:hypothetical protein